MESRDVRPHLRVSSRTAQAPVFVHRGARAAADRREGRIDSRDQAEDRPASRPDRLLEVRRRIASHYYDQPHIADQVARRILERGDL